MRRILLFLSYWLCSGFVLGGCGDDGGSSPFHPPDGGLSRLDQLITLDGRDRDLSIAPDLPVNQDGPTIEILSPTADQIVVGNVLTVRAKVTDNDGIDAQTVAVTLQSESAQPLSMGLTTTPQVYEAQLDVRAVAGRARLWVVASDLLGNANSMIREFRRDPGPVIRFVSPAQESRHKSSVSLDVAVGDTFEVTSFKVRLGSQELTLKEISRQASETRYATTIAFDDPAFGAPLAGKQVLTAEATNENGARSVETRTFFVDVEGPEITILTHEPGGLIGSVIEVAAQIEDPAGVNPATVQCIIGNELLKRTVTLRQDDTDAALFSGQFDTSTLSDEQLWPVMSFRAEDTLGNRSHRDIEVGLDNGAPIVSLDPPENFAYWRKEDDVRKCSRWFDPVGREAVNDLDEVHQTPSVRARIEDDGNFVPHTWLPIAVSIQSRFGSTSCPARPTSRS